MVGSLPTETGFWGSCAKSYDLPQLLHLQCIPSGAFTLKLCCAKSLFVYSTPRWSAAWRLGLRLQMHGCAALPAAHSLRAASAFGSLQEGQWFPAPRDYSCMGTNFGEAQLINVIPEVAPVRLQGQRQMCP